MFEAVILLCLDGQSEICREVLIPGFAATTQAGCETRFGTDLKAQGAICQPEGPKLSVTEVAPGVFVHQGQVADPDMGNRGDVSNLGFVIGWDSVAVIDTGTAAWMGEALWRSIRARTDLPVSHVILTHMHPDHVLGGAVFEAMGAEVLGHAKLPQALADRQANYRESLARLIGPGVFLGSSAPRITRSIGGLTEVDLGNRVLELQPVPTAHTGTDLTVLDRSTGTLFAGDLVFQRHLPALDGSLRGWQMVLQQMAEKPVARIIPGHGGLALDWPDGLAPMQRYLDRLAQDTRAAIAAGERLGQAITHVAAQESAHWELFEIHNPRNATVAYTELEWE